MIGAIQTKDIILKKLGQDCKKVCDYDKDSYLLLVGKDEDFYLMNKKDGRYRPLNPLEDFSTFINALENKVLFDFKK